MNIAFLLTPKSEVIYEYIDATMRHSNTTNRQAWKVCWNLNRR